MTNTTLPTYDTVCCGEYGTRNGVPVVAIGDRLTYETLGKARGLVPSGDRFSTWRYPVFGAGPIQCVAVEVEITGHVWKWKQGAGWQRARITFVGDGEPDTYARGWVRVR